MKMAWLTADKEKVLEGPPGTRTRAVLEWALEPPRTKMASSRTESGRGKARGRSARSSMALLSYALESYRSCYESADTQPGRGSSIRGDDVAWLDCDRSITAARTRTRGRRRREHRCGLNGDDSRSLGIIGPFRLVRMPASAGCQRRQVLISWRRRRCGWTRTGSNSRLGRRTRHAF